MIRTNKILRRHRMNSAKQRRRIIVGSTALACIAGLGIGVFAASATEKSGAATAAGSTDWLAYSNGALHYRKDKQGNRIPDFSQVGYHAGDKPIPSVPAEKSLAPTPSGDDTSRIQAALNAVAATGKPGAVLLKPGTYRLSGTVRIRASGLVLRGSGAIGGNRTLLQGTGKPHALIQIGAANGKPIRVGNTLPVTDTYVPVGSTTLHATGAAASLKVGDRIIVQRPQEKNWITAIGMDKIPNRPSGTASKQWTPGSGLQFERTVTGVSGTTVTLDVPLTNALEQAYTHATVWKYTFAQHVSESGVEDLAGDGRAMESDPSWHDSGYFKTTLVSVDGTENSWVRNVTATRFGQAYVLGSEALHISVLNTKSLQEGVPQDIHATPVAYTISGQQDLVSACTVTGSNLHAWSTMGRVAGPDVFTDCTATNTGTRGMDAGPHMKWATGVLYDHMTMDSSGFIQLQDRSWMGSGQGWAGANSVLYNVLAAHWLVENPPTAHNWAIGITGIPKQTPSGHVLGEVQSAGKPLTAPVSLYAQQLAERHVTR
ncbi:hypothetical protein [Streptomyces sp. NPDC006668]|uniref:hypothetical protein n=1 Tax=Streptomyces sp. NPDC006668 TaxID=3156903 RepID=UPI0033D03439